MHRLLKLNREVTGLQIGLMDLKEGLKDLRELDKENARLTAETNSLLRKLKRQQARLDKYLKA